MPINKFKAIVLIFQRTDGYIKQLFIMIVSVKNCFSSL